MSDEELEQDDIESTDDDDTEDFAAAADEPDVEVDDSAEAEEPAAGKGKKKKEAEPEELPSIEAKQKERDALAKAIEEFLARGGKVQEIDANVVADPPKKPDSKYGSRPI